MTKTVASNRASRAWRRATMGVLTAMTAVFAWGLTRCEVEGGSMLPTLQPGDRLLLRRRRRFGHLAPGTVVAFADPRPGLHQLMVKRVTQVEGTAVTVLGDNPAASTDSRTFGPVDRASIPWVVVRRYRRAETSLLDP